MTLPGSLFLIACSSALLLAQQASAQHDRQLVRMAVISVDAGQLAAYNEALKEEIEASIRLEPGVLTLYAVASKAQPSQVTIFETYADSAQYRAHLNTPHFLKYKSGTLQMVAGLQLLETQPLIYEHKPVKNPTNPTLFVRMAKLTIEPSRLEEFERIVKNTLAPGVRQEAGVVAIYGVSEKANPEKISVLEIYTDEAAYKTHLATPHFAAYKRDTQAMVLSLEIVELVPVYLGAK